MGDLQEKLQAYLPESIGHALAIVLILLCVWLFYRYCVASLRKLLVRLGASPGVVSFLFNTTRALLLCVVVLSALRQLGVETTSLLALLGAGSAALLLALQGFMGNFAAGLVLLSQRMMHLGDTIEVGDVRGQVVEMQALHVVVETPEQVRITVPNSLLVNGPLRNHSALPTRRVQWLLPLPLGVDLNLIKKDLGACLLADGRIREEPPPAMFLRDWALDKQTLVVQAWTASGDAQLVQDQLLEQLAAILERCTRQPASSQASGK